jgi:hypothetical protein
MAQLCSLHAHNNDLTTKNVPHLVNTYAKQTYRSFSNWSGMRGLDQMARSASVQIIIPSRCCPGTAGGNWQQMGYQYHPSLTMHADR